MSALCPHTHFICTHIWISHLSQVFCHFLIVNIAIYHSTIQVGVFIAKLHRFQFPHMLYDHPLSVINISTVQVVVFITTSTSIITSPFLSQELTSCPPYHFCFFMLYLIYYTRNKKKERKKGSQVPSVRISG